MWARTLVATMKSNFEYFFNIFFAKWKFKGFFIVAIPAFFAIFAEFVGSIPNIFEYLFFANFKNEPSLLPMSKF